MARALRKTGLSVLGDMPWGTHFCYFYETKQDLLDTLVPYFQAGLEHNEFCLWVIAAPLTAEDAQRALRHAVPDLDRYLAERTIELLPYDAWYHNGGVVDLRRIIAGWHERLDRALARGYSGMRVTGDTAWLQKQDWKDFSDYEHTLDAAMANRPMIALCTYSLATSGAAEILDVVRTHQLALARRNGDWEVVELPELKRAKAEITRLNAALEQRVVERTSELAATNEVLRRELTERKLAEAAFRASQQQYEALVQSIDGIVWEVDARTFSFTFVSKQAERILGYPVEQWLNEPNFWTTHLYPDDRDWAVGFCVDATERRENHQFEYRMIAADGRVVWLRDIVTMHIMEDKSVRLRGIMVDVTERKQTEDDLRKQKEILQTIFDHIPVMISFFSVDGRYQLVNRAWERTRGWSLREIQQQNVDILAESYPDQLESQRVMDFAAAATGEWADFKTRVRDGRVIDTAWASVHLADGTRIGIGQDITARKRAEEELRQHAVRMEALAEISQTLAAVGLDVQTVLDTIVRHTAEVIGDACVIALVLGDEQRLQPVAFHHPDPEVKTFMSQLLTSAPQYTENELFSHILHTGQPALIPFVPQEQLRQMIAPQHWPYLERAGIHSLLVVALRVQGQIIGTLGVTRDAPGRPYTPHDQAFLLDLADRAALTLQNARLFEQVQGAHERLQTLSRRLLEVQEAERRAIARELHDEIGQRLTGLGLLLTPSQQLSPDLAQDQLVQAQALVRELMDQVRNLALDLRPAMLDDFGLVSALVWLFERYTTQTNVSVRFEHSGLEEQRFAPDVETAAYRIVQEALTNVARHAGVPEVIVRLWTDADTLVVVIMDQGRGFDPQMVRTRASSGLAGMHERAALLGGELTIESVPGAGTQATATLPRNSADASKEQEHDT